MGWRALGVCLLTYQDVHHLRTIREIIGRWAPPSDNNPTSAYARFVASRMGITVDEAVDLRSNNMLSKLAKAIAIEEGGAEIDWPPDPQAEGLQMALAASV